MLDGWGKQVYYKRVCSTDIFLWILQKNLRTLFYRTPSHDYFLTVLKKILNDETIASIWDK